VTIDNNKRATITAVGGQQFEVNDDGIFPVQMSPTGRRLAKTNSDGAIGFGTIIVQVRCQLHPARCLSPAAPAFLGVGVCRKPPERMHTATAAPCKHASAGPLLMT
jgi:hypothetical protein